jgi:hypothetical protein
VAILSVVFVQEDTSILFLWGTMDIHGRTGSVGSTEMWIETIKFFVNELNFIICIKISNDTKRHWTRKEFKVH